MAILFPVFALFALTLFVQFRLAYLRYSAVKRGEVSPGYFRLFRGDAEPEKLAAYSRNYVNLHESPILFYVICLIIFSAGIGGTMLTLLAWAYAFLRYLHSWVHLTSNHVLHRFRIFAFGSLVLGLLWGLALIKLIQIASSAG